MMTSFMRHQAETGPVQMPPLKVTSESNHLVSAEISQLSDKNESENWILSAHASHVRFQDTGNPADLDESIQYARQSLNISCTPSESAERLHLLGQTLKARCSQTFVIGDIEEAIACNRRALELRALGNLERDSSLVNLANCLRMRFEHNNTIQDLEEAVECNRELLQLRPPGHCLLGAAFVSLALVLFRKFEQSGATQDLDEAIDYNLQALKLHSPGHPDRKSPIINLASALHRRFEQRGAVQDLEEAIKYNQQAIELCPPGNPTRNIPLINLANALKTKFEQSCIIEDLDDAINCTREALELCPPGHPHRNLSYINMASAIYRRFEQSGSRQDLEEAIDCNRKAVDLCPIGHHQRSLPLINLGSVYQKRFELDGDAQDLEEAIGCNLQALKASLPGHHSRNSSLINLANTLRTRFEQGGMIQDLDEAINYIRQALQLCVPGHHSRNLSLINLASATLARFGRTGAIQDLNEAIDRGRQALELCPPGNSRRNLSLINLANATLVRFKEHGTPEDLNESIECNRKALEISPLGHPMRNLALINLGNGFQLRFEKDCRPQDLEEAIACFHEALELCTPGNPNRGLSLLNLSRALALRPGTDMQDAAVHLQEAIDILPTLHPLHATVKSDLANVYLEQWQLQDEDEEEDLGMQLVEKALQLLEEASDHPTSNLKERLKTAVHWSYIANALEHESATRAHIAALAHLNRIYFTMPTLDRQHESLISSDEVSRSFASDAASSSIEMGRLDIAIEILEQGSSILWSRMRGYRHPLVELRKVDPGLVLEFERLSRQLELHATSASTTQDPEEEKIDPEIQQRLYRRLSGQWDEVVEKIRRTEGFANFLQPVPFSTLRTAAAEGPVIVVNVSDVRSDAIILVDGTDPVLVPLPHASPEMLSRLSSLFADPGAATADGFSKQMCPVLRTLWRIVVQPIVKKLAELGVPKRSRIWWCPTSHLCALPIHAAGPYLPGESSLSDLYISSYIPALLTLIVARSNLTHSPKAPTLLVIAQPDESLPSIGEEIRRIKLFSDYTPTIGAEATPKATLSNLRSHSWVHFACHGHRNPQPFHSYFQLHGGERLELLDIMTAQLPNAEFAFLSACHGAWVDQNAPDESINLASSLQFCGFRSVVGTLWSMDDGDGPQVAEDFYRYMFRNPGRVDFKDAATALNLATRNMRKRQGMTLGRWVNFIHIGA